MPTQGGNILHTKWPMKIHGKGLLFGVVAYLKKIFLAQWEQSFTRASVRSNLQLIITKLPTWITFLKKYQWKLLLLCLVVLVSFKFIFGHFPL